MALDKIIADKEHIIKLIPQKPPMVMVDKLFFSDETRTITGLSIIEENIFCQDGFLKEPGIIENIAQSAATRVGYYCEQNNITKIPIRFIAAIKKLQIFELPKIGTDIQTEIIIDYEVFDFSLVTGIIRQNEKIIAQCEMKIFLKKD
jgi:predicted hotdog family 3-hydroxylacyl-ACP dehydratase